jgi:hypothetical protein
MAVAVPIYKLAPWNNHCDSPVLNHLHVVCVTCVMILSMKTCTRARDGCRAIIIMSLQVADFEKKKKIKLLTLRFLVWVPLREALAFLCSAYDHCTPSSEVNP